MTRDVLTADFIARATGGSVLFDGGAEARGISVDSREINAESHCRPVFAAVRGERTDGRLYTSKAIENGCAGIIIDGDADFPVDTRDVFAVRVDSTVPALGRLAAEYIKRFDIPRVAVTGSVGKTTTRGMISAILSRKYRTHSTSGNFNNELGVPLTVLGMKDGCRAGVFELGMGRKGDISYLSGIVRPTVGVITSVGTAHIEFLGSREAIRDAKLEICDGMGDGSQLILNGDEPLLLGIAGATYCSLEDPCAQWFAYNIRHVAEGTVFDVHHEGEIFFRDVFVPAYGEHIVLDALLSWAVGRRLGVRPEDIAAGLASFVNIGQRQKIERHGGITLIVDCYNASAESVKASEKVGRRLAGKGRFITVFGDVLELGEHSKEIHREIGRFSAEMCDAFITVGTEARHSAEAAKRTGLGDVVEFSGNADADTVADEIFRQIGDKENGTVILFKASHGMNLGRIADAVRRRLAE